MATDERIREIGEINYRAFEMAQAVADDPSRREALGEEAAALKERLFALFDALGPAGQQVAQQVSESQLDLDFVIEDSPTVSLRLGHYLR